MDRTPHEHNHGFEWRPIGGPLRRLSQEQADQYNASGFFVLDDAISPEVVERVTAEIDVLEEKTEKFLSTQPDGKLFINRAGELTFSTHLVQQSQYLKDFVRSHPFCDIVADVLGPDVRLYWDQAVYKKPGKANPFPWHQDNGYTFIEPQQYLTCWLALTDATEENGCPEVALGLHHEGTLAHELTDIGFRCLPDEFKGVAAPARAGSMVVFSSLTPHRTGPNLSHATRKAYIVQFAPDGVRQIFLAESGDVSSLPASDPDRQFMVLRDGRPVLAD